MLDIRKTGLSTLCETCLLVGTGPNHGTTQHRFFYCSSKGLPQPSGPSAPQPQKKQGASLSGPLSESWTLDFRKGNRESQVVRAPRDVLTREDWVNSWDKTTHMQVFLLLQRRVTSAFRAFRPQPQKKQGVSLSGPLSES